MFFGEYSSCCYFFFFTNLFHPRAKYVRKVRPRNFSNASIHMELDLELEPENRQVVDGSNSETDYEDVNTTLPTPSEPAPVPDSTSVPVSVSVKDAHPGDITRQKRQRIVREIAKALRQFEHRQETFQCPEYRDTCSISFLGTKCYLCTGLD